MTRGKKRMLTLNQIEELEREIVKSGKHYKQVAIEAGLKPPTVYKAFMDAHKVIPNLKTRKKKSIPAEA